MNRLLVFPKRWLSILFCFTVVFGYAQNSNAIDSLKQELTQLKKLTNEHVDLLLELADEYVDIDLEKAIDYSTDALQIAKNQPNILNVAKSLFALGNFFRLQGEPQKALDFMNRAKLLYFILGDQKKLQRTLGNIAQTYLLQSKFSEALTYSFYVLRMAEKSNDLSALIAVNNALGNIYYAQGKFSESLVYFKAALQHFNRQTTKDTNHEFVLHRNLANVFLDLGNYEQAEHYIEASRKIASKVESLDFMYVVLIQRGYLSFEQGRFEESIGYFQEAYPVAQQLGSRTYEASVHLEIGRAYLKWAKEDKTNSQNQTHFEQAVLHLEQSAGLFLEIENLNEYQYIQELISECYQALGNYQEALLAHQEFVKYKDSLYHEEQVAEITRIEMNHTFSKEQDSIQFRNEKEIAIRELKIQEKNKQTWALSLGLLLFGFFGFFVFRQNQIIKKKNLELIASNTLKLRFFNLINHDLRSPIAHLLESLYIQKDNPNNSNLLDMNIVAVENLYETMDDILLWSKGQMEQFEPQKNHIDLSKLIESTLKTIPIPEHVVLLWNFEENIFFISDENYLKTIIRNLVSNALHAIKAKSSAQIQFKTWKDDNAIHMSITDNGKGAPMEYFDPLFHQNTPIGSKNGLGLHLIRDLARAIECDIDVKSELGSGTTIHLKLRNEGTLKNDK